MRFLARDLPAPASHAQRDVLWKEVIECASRAGLHFHAEYHRTITPGPCTGAPMNAMAVLGTNREADPRVAIRRWGRAFLPDFERTHPWPAAVRAAIILRKQRRRRVAIARLCSNLGVSKTALAREFRALDGMSIADYRRRARTGWVVGELAGSGVCIESIALRAGYRRPGSLYDTLRLLTGLSPTQVRPLSSDDVRDVLDGPLSLHMRRIPPAGSPPLSD